MTAGEGLNGVWSRLPSPLINAFCPIAGQGWNAGQDQNGGTNPALTSRMTGGRTFLSIDSVREEC
ncbi:hypothetical protein ACFL55_03440 [Candidatus Latescibacterota bacterium]